MNRKVRNLLASVVLGVCLLALSFIPSFAANSANSASVGNVEAMKENVVYDFQSLSFADAPDYVKGIKSVSVNKTKWEEASSRLSLMRREAYYRNTDENKLYFEFGGSSSVARVSKYEVSDVGEEIEFVFVPHRMHFFDKVTEDAIVL